MPLLSRKRVIAIKDETTYGTDSVPVAANCILVRDLSITPLSTNTVSRQLIRPFLGISENLIADSSVQVTFVVELAGSGTRGTAPRYGPALKACGLSETIVATTSVTYAPISAAFSGVTIYYNVDGILHRVTGCRGTFTINCTLKEIPTISFTFTGIYNAPTDTAALTPSYGAQATPLLFKAGNTTGFSLFSYSGCLNSFSFDLGNTLVFRELIGCSREVIITDRAPSGNVEIELVTLATKNYFTDALADGTTGNLAFAQGTAAGNIVTFTAPTIDINTVGYQDQDGIHHLSVPYVAVPTGAGNNEFSLAYT